MMKVILTAVLAALAVTAGLVVTMLAALVSIGILAVKRWRHRPAAGTHAASRPPEPVERMARSRDVDVIDVIATEVPADPVNR